MLPSVIDRFYGGLILVFLFTVLVGGSYYAGHVKGYKSGHAVAAQELEKEFTSYKKAQENLFREEIQRSLETQQALSDQLNSLRMEKEVEIKNINDRYASLVRSLRNRLSRAEAATNQSTYPSDPTTTTIERTGTGCTGAGLLREDAEFLAGEAAAADTLKQSLKECRAAHSSIVDMLRKYQEGTYRESNQE